MKHIRIFSSHSEYELSELPNLYIAYDNEHLHYSSETSVKYSLVLEYDNTTTGDTNQTMNSYTYESGATVDLQDLTYLNGSKTVEYVMYNADTNELIAEADYPFTVTVSSLTQYIDIAGTMPEYNVKIKFTVTTMVIDTGDSDGPTLEDLNTELD